MPECKVPSGKIAVGVVVHKIVIEDSTGEVPVDSSIGSARSQVFQSLKVGGQVG